MAEGKVEFEQEKLLLAKGVKASLVFPVYINGNIAGFIGFNKVTSPGEWGKDSVLILGTASQIIGSALERDMIQKELKIKNEELLRTNNLMVGRELKMVELKNTIKRLEEASKK